MLLEINFLTKADDLRGRNTFFVKHVFFRRDADFSIEFLSHFWSYILHSAAGKAPFPEVSEKRQTIYRLSCSNLVSETWEQITYTDSWRKGISDGIIKRIPAVAFVASTSPVDNLPRFCGKPTRTSKD